VNQKAYLRSPISIHAGFVILSNPSVLPFPPNMTLGSGCCGNVEPAGSDGPGIRLTGRDDWRISVIKKEAVFVG
jgi:hypothetical protein